jgi:N-methylhydantoinase A/oxoprolinase/acetone carboxylase beta subunit
VIARGTGYVTGGDVVLSEFVQDILHQAVDHVPRLVDFGEQGRNLAEVLGAALLEPGMTLTGPAVIEDSSSSLVVSPGKRVEMDRLGNLHVFLREEK